VAGDTATQAALEEVAGELRSAKADGRLIQALPLDVVDQSYLVRDRISLADSEMEALRTSLRARGQQTPIEVVELEGGQFGLISGWRRLTALHTLYEETGDDSFATVKALLRQPATASDAYLAMVEENEIRVGLSYYERARIAARAAERGVYPDEGAALRGLFAAASRAKRSKIGSFVRIYHALDAHLRFASAISERLGLAIAKVLKKDPSAAKALTRALGRQSATSPEDEAATLSRALASVAKSSASVGLEESNNKEIESIKGVHLTANADQSRLTLSGPGLSEGLIDDLRTWLAARV
jgi:hypothetical protein